MKYFLILIATFFSQHVLFAQDQPDGPYKDYYDSGELYIEGQYKDNKRVGEWKKFHKNGQLSKIYSYTDGKLNKEEISYTEDGKVSTKVIKQGEGFLRIGYYENGNLMYERQLDSGYYKSFYENGVKEIEAHYIDNELSGKWKKFNEDGNLEWVVTYQDGYRHGIYQKYYPSGKLKVEGLMLKEKKQSTQWRYREDETLEWKGFYEADKAAKTWIRYDRNGKKIEKIRVKDDPSVLNLEMTEVPDGVLEKVPVYPGCEEVYGNKARLNCMNRAVSVFVSENFDSDLANKLGLYGKYRILVQFRVDKSGAVTHAKAKARDSKLAEEAVRVINLLPSMKPGEQKGKPVIIPFSLPLLYSVQD
ncbi:toxin-antitoxin system YwqK family antitoxin [Winogradskyella tangerina]|uniref:toxin-antitoxin system YwqK family antitoxin n=1 Tax=Winogradskyella tangerina TaxID=2023240 RepID=UPI000DBE1FFD|nr:toxin-antitoxin system YwqK family antitoxin [Winogradskyella tangerina]